MPAKKKPVGSKPSPKRKAKKERTVVRRSDPKPEFDGTELWLGDVRIGTFSQRAGQQIAALNAFQAAGWPRRIPWPPHLNGDARKAHSRVRRLASDLTAAVEGSGLVFHADGYALLWAELEVTDRSSEGRVLRVRADSSRGCAVLLHC